MWGGRFSGDTSELFKKFNASLPIDYQLVNQDIEGSVAWANALLEAKILSATECANIISALEDIAAQVEHDKLQILASDAEDIHSWVELELIKRVGDLGKKLHTGRSRNDQVLTDLKLWCRKTIAKVKHALRDITMLLNEQAALHSDAIMPSYTHLQRAQPITFGFWLDAARQMFVRDFRRLELLSSLSDECPLGASAIAGTAFDIDRDKLAISLGFSKASENALDCVSDRDFVIDLLYCCSTSVLHLSRLSEDLIFFNSQEAGFVILDDSVTSGSSLMPQKKNPDSLELIRGKSAQTYANLSQMLMAIKSLPLGYNKDLQQDKAALFDSMNAWFDSLAMFRQVISTITINRESMFNAVENSFSNATELADYLVSLGVPFRDAHHQTGSLVKLAEAKKCYLKQLSLIDFKAVNELVDENVYAWLNCEKAIERRQVRGGVGYHSLSAKNILDAPLQDATLNDVDGIYDLVKYWSEAGENLPRSKEDILNQLASFKLIKDKQGAVVACGCLHIYDANLVEIRSVGVRPERQGKGFGKRIVFALLAQANRLGLSQAFVLTRQPEFFAGCDFRKTSIDNLPKKILKDCQFCPRKEHCDEIAMIYALQ